MAQVKNEEEKKKETTKRVTKKATTPEKVAGTSKNKEASKTSKETTAKKQTTTKKSTTTRKTKVAKEAEKIEEVAKKESEDIKKVKEESSKKEVKKRSSKKEPADKKDTKKKTTTKKEKTTTKTSKTKASKNTKNAKGKVTKIIGSRKQEEVEEDDVVITDAKEADIVKVEDKEKMQIMENEVKKDLKSKNKLPKTEEKKLSSVVFENLCVAIAVMIYLFFILLGFMNIKEEVYIVDLKVFSFIILVIAILLFERAYKKDSGKLCAFGIETLFLSIATMSLLYVNIEVQNIFLPIAASISLLFAIYYVAKSIYLYSKMKKKYFVDNMKDIIQKEEKE